MLKRKPRVPTGPRAVVDGPDPGAIRDGLDTVAIRILVTAGCEEGELRGALWSVNADFFGALDTFPVRKLRKLADSLSTVAAAVERFEAANPFAVLALLTGSRQESERARRQFPATARSIAGDLAALADSKAKNPRALRILALAYLIAIVDVRIDGRLRLVERDEMLGRLVGREPEALSQFRHRHRAKITMLRSDLHRSRRAITDQEPRGRRLRAAERPPAIH
jgi:hypothetical protein